VDDLMDHYELVACPGPPCAYRFSSVSLLGWKMRLSRMAAHIHAISHRPRLRHW
jgi:hypothetical protein